MVGRQRAIAVALYLEHAIEAGAEILECNRGGELDDLRRARRLVAVGAADREMGIAAAAPALKAALFGKIDQVLLA